MHIKIGLLGLGTIGSGVVQMLQQHQGLLAHRAGCSMEIAKILVRDINKKRPIELPIEILTTNSDEIIFNPEIDIVVEVMGGIKQSRDLISQALQNHKHVVTANKDVMAAFGTELLDIAKKNGCDLFYEASVAGGIPIIRGLVDGLASDNITKVQGIVNGTTNYILTKMSQENMQYQDALKLAQDLGFAEPDPTSDVEGLDAARKILILAKIAFSMKLELSDVKVKGISQITKEDIAYASQLGYAVKLIGLAEKSKNAVEVSVQPTLIPVNHPLASVQNEYNAVYVTGDFVGESMFYGKGAGAFPTATSIVSDLIATVKNIKLKTNSEGIRTQYLEKCIQKDSDTYSKFFLRMHVKDELGVFSKIASIFLEHHLSFENILQKPFLNENGAEITIITHEVSIENFNKSLEAIRKMDEVEEIKNYFRVLGAV